MTETLLSALTEQKYKLHSTTNSRTLIHKLYYKRHVTEDWLQTEPTRSKWTTTWTIKLYEQIDYFLFSFHFEEGNLFGLFLSNYDVRKTSLPVLLSFCKLSLQTLMSGSKDLTIQCRLSLDLLLCRPPLNSTTSINVFNFKKKVYRFFFWKMLKYIFKKNCFNSNKVSFFAPQFSCLP